MTADLGDPPGFFRLARQDWEVESPSSVTDGNFSEDDERNPIASSPRKVRENPSLFGKANDNVLHCNRTAD